MERRTFVKAGLGLGGVAAVGASIDMTGVGAPDNPYLMGNYAPVLDEITETSIQVTGSIPTDLNGLFLRNGPNPIDWVNPKKHHWFLGDGMLHGVRLENGNALWYKNRRVLGNDSTANTSVISHAGHTYAVVEAGGYPVEIDGELNSLNTKPFYGDRNEGFTAHPKFDADTGELHA
ncbi:MAG: carotenoid oxygenase family protein, partial [Gammaproteobacteria bacterium]